MTKKIADLDNELAEYKATAGERFKRIESTLEALKLDLEKRHAEIMNILMNQTKTPPPPPPPISADRPPPITLVSQPPIFLDQPPILSTQPLGFTTQSMPPLSSIPMTLTDDGFQFNEGGSNHGKSKAYSGFGSFQPPISNFVVGNTGIPSWGSGPESWFSQPMLRKLKMSFFEGKDAWWEDLAKQLQRIFCRPEDKSQKGLQNKDCYIWDPGIILSMFIKPHLEDKLPAGNVQPYQFVLPPTWKQLRIANILSGNYCQPKCAEPWIEVKFEDEKQGKVQVVASPLIRLTNKPNATIEDIGSPEKVIASLGPFVTGNTFDSDELLETSIEKSGDQTVSIYKLVL